MNNYSIYPTLLDSFYWAKIKGTWQELLDKINRVEVIDYSESALKGMRFEALINNTLDGELFDQQTEFDCDLVDRIATMVCNNVGKQKYIERIIKSKYGNIKLYGYVDYAFNDHYIDLKTCEKYKPDKYRNYSQHKFYPFVGYKPELTYLITDFKRIYTETYAITEKTTSELFVEITQLIEWLEVHRSEITDTKIFTI